MHLKDVLFIEVTDSKGISYSNLFPLVQPLHSIEKYAFGIMNKIQKKKLKFAPKTDFARTTWRKTIEQQLEKHTPTDSTFNGGESMVIVGSPRYGGRVGGGEGREGEECGN